MRKSYDSRNDTNERVPVVEQREHKFRQSLAGVLLGMIVLVVVAASTTTTATATTSALRANTPENDNHFLFDRHLVDLLKAFDGLSGGDDDVEDSLSGDESSSGDSGEDSSSSSGASRLFDRQLVDLLKAFDGLSGGDDGVDDSSSGVSMSGDGTSLSDSGDDSSSGSSLLFDRHLVDLLKAFDGLSGNDDSSGEDNSGEEDEDEYESLEDEEDSEEEYEDEEEEYEDEDSSSDETGPTAAPAPGSTCDVMYYTAADVATHNTATDCHVILYDVVYDLTPWVNLHPGGPARITAMCGSDGTTAYVAKHTSPNNINRYGSSYILGRLGLTSGMQLGPCL